MHSYKFSVTPRTLHESGGWIEHSSRNFTTVVQARNSTEATNMVQAQYGNSSKIIFLGSA
jgi:hypothetical protein